MTTKCMIFFSWQSDLDKVVKHKTIKHCIQNAINSIEIEDDVSFHLDEATRGEIGSIEIPNTILSKIRKADIFICDVTTINTDDSPKRPMPNPNVLIELGYAVAELGWDRILLIFNTSFGTFPNDLPFDIEKRRVTKFNISNSRDVYEKNSLSDKLKLGIKSVYVSSPIRARDSGKDTEELKRYRDLNNLRELLRHLNTDFIDSFIDNLPEKIHGDVFRYKEIFDGVYNKSTFYIYDAELGKLLDLFYCSWNIVLSFGSIYFLVNESNHLVRASDKIYNNKIDASNKGAKAFKKNYKLMLKYIRMKFLEIDLGETNEQAILNFCLELRTNKILDA